MIHRFRGPNGRRLLVDTLLRQHSINGNRVYAEAIAGNSELQQFAPKEQITVQGNHDNDIFFILVGRVSILVHGREVNQRNAGEHVGEMALIDPSSSRSATVEAIDLTVAAKMTEEQFTKTADIHPQLWRNVAVDLADRLRQRNDLVRPKNEKPHIFIGSSKESLDVAIAIQKGFDHDGYIITVWTDGVFGASSFPIIDLEREIDAADFAVLVADPDDRVVSRGATFDAPRDNIVFEIGLFMGALGHDRVYIVHAREFELKIPTDLLGLNTLKYEKGESSTITARLGIACTAIRTAINKYGLK